MEKTRLHHINVYDLMTFLCHLVTSCSQTAYGGGGLWVCVAHLVVKVHTNPSSAVDKPKFSFTEIGQGLTTHQHIKLAYYEILHIHLNTLRKFNGQLKVH